MRRLAILLALPLAARGEEKTELEQPPVSLKAKELREKADALWAGLQPVWEKVRAKKDITPAEAAGALPGLEEAVDLFERSLHEEWHGDANRALADAARAWWRLYPLVPPPAPPTDDDARKKAEQALETARRQRTTEVRDFVMKYGRERRVESLFRTCPKCEGRKEIRSPFGEKMACKACDSRGRLLERDGIIAARWLRHSPLYRMAGRNEQILNKLLRSMPPDAQRDVFAPYIRSVAIKDVEDHDVWMRVKVREEVQPSALSPKADKGDATYLLFRVAKVWYLYDEQYDRDLLDLTGQ